MTQHTARPDQHARSAEEDEDVAFDQARQPERRPGAHCARRSDSRRPAMAA